MEWWHQANEWARAFGPWPGGLLGLLFLLIFAAAMEYDLRRGRAKEAKELEDANRQD